MSYDISFKLNDEIVELPFEAPFGGTYCPGSYLAEFNITFNYCNIFIDHKISIVHHESDPDDVEFLNGKSAGECVQIIENALPRFNKDIEPTADYWDATEGNARKSLEFLLKIAKAVPAESVCEVAY